MVYATSALVGGTLTTLIRVRNQPQQGKKKGCRRQLRQAQGSRQSMQPVLETNTLPSAHPETQAPNCPRHRAASGSKGLCPPPTLRFRPHDESHPLN